MANIFHVERTDNKITLGTTGTIVYFGGHTASKILALDASKDLEVVTIGTGLDYTRPTLSLADPLVVPGKLTAGSFASPLDVTNTRQYGFEIHYSGNDYDVTGIRSRAQLITTDTTATAQGALLQAANNDNINVGVLNGALIEAIGKATTNAATIIMMRGCLVNTEWSAKDTVTDLRILHVRTHTRDAATEGYVSGTGYGIYIENEAVGGNGQVLDAGIYFKGTNLSAGNKAFTYGMDFSGATYGTAEIKLFNGETIDNLTDGVVELSGKLLSTNYTATNKLTACATNAGALDFSVASKTLTIAGNAIVDQDLRIIAQVEFSRVTTSGNVICQATLVAENTILIIESASPAVNEATYGQIWVKNATPNELWFTDDAGNDALVANEKTQHTSIGGYAIKLTNNTGVASVKGQLVETDDTDENAYKKADANALDPIGVVYNAGVADGSEVWIVIAGIAEVLLDAGGCVHHDRLITSATAGSADVNNAPAVAVHFQEIGHAIETVVGAGLAKAVIHFL